MKWVLLTTRRLSQVSTHSWGSRLFAPGVRLDGLALVLGVNVGDASLLVDALGQGLGVGGEQTEAAGELGDARALGGGLPFLDGLVPLLPQVSGRRDGSRPP